MIGIYRIANKLSGKSYIGQSIHCGKRFDEHTKGKQLVDQIIQVEGVENFTFELLKECGTGELSYWEDYYIIKYDTMYPNGYNKRWNCSEEIRDKIRGEIESEIKSGIENETIEPRYKDLLVLNAAFKGEQDFIKLTSKQWSVYYWLILNSYQSSKNQYIIHKTFALSDIRQDLGISDNRTIKAALEILKKNNLIIVENQIIYIPYPKSYTQLSSEMLNFLFEICVTKKFRTK